MSSRHPQNSFIGRGEKTDPNIPKSGPLLTTVRVKVIHVQKNVTSDLISGEKRKWDIFCFHTFKLRFLISFFIIQGNQGDAGIPGAPGPKGVDVSNLFYLPIP